MAICEVPTLQLKALNKHRLTHIMMYIEMEMLSAIKMYIYKKKKEKKLTHNLDKGSSVTMQKMHTHTHACTHARTHALTHTHTQHTHTYTTHIQDTHTHTHTHTHTQFIIMD